MARQYQYCFFCYGARTSLIVNTAEYLCTETSTKVSSEPLSWESRKSRKLCGGRCIKFNFDIHIERYATNRFHGGD